MLKRFLYEESGGASIEVAIITVTLVAVAIVFKRQIMDMVQAIAKKLLG